MTNYIVKETRNDGKITYYLSGHSTLSEGASLISKYYTYTNIRGANMLKTRLEKEANDSSKKYEVVECADVGIIVN